MNTLYMYRAIQIARLAHPLAVQPNPLVGAVLVYDEGDTPRIIGEGWHQRRGEAHAEVNCLDSVAPGDRTLIQHSTMYVTLEPCAHVGRTPACAHRLVEHRVPRVVIGCGDPNPLVAGKGIAILEQAGIQVTSGVLQQECHDLARVFMVNQTEQRPYILLKWAETQEGYLDSIRTPALPALKISSPFTQMLVHGLRSRYRAIVIGANTFLLDHPSLTNRLWIGGSPRPIIIDPNARCHEALCKRSDAERWSLVCLDSSAPQSPTPYTLITTTTRSELLPSLLQWLYQQECMSLIVEGGSETLKAFIQAGLYDEVRIEKSPYPLNQPNGISAPTPLYLQLCSKVEYDQRTIHFYSHL